MKPAQPKPKRCRICGEPGADGHTCSMESYLRNHPEFAAELAQRGQRP